MYRRAVSTKARLHAPTVPCGPARLSQRLRLMFATHAFTGGGAWARFLISDTTTHWGMHDRPAVVTLAAVDVGRAR